MSDLDELISQFSNYSEPYTFYNGTITLWFNSKNHTYSRETPDGLIVQDGVSTVCNIIDKSEPLMAWAVKMMAQKILETVPHDTEYLSQAWMNPIKYVDFESLILAAKSAHKEKLDDASNIGKIAHLWIENLIKADIDNDLERKLYFLNNLPEDYQAANCCEAATDWMSWHNIRWLSTEKKVYSLQYGYGGTLDGLCWADSCDDEKCCRVAFKNRLTLVDWKTSNQLNIEYLLQSAAYLQAHVEEHKEQITDRWVIRLGKEDAEFEPWHCTDATDDFNAFLHCLNLKRTLKVIEERIKERSDEIKAIRKEERRVEKEEALAIKCNRSARYKGKRKPQCNGGIGCETCREKYALLHPDA